MESTLPQFTLETKYFEKSEKVKLEIWVKYQQKETSAQCWGLSAAAKLNKNIKNGGGRTQSCKNLIIKKSKNFQKSLS